MAESTKKKKSIFNKIGYYFRVDFRTIQGRLTGGFLSLALISFILIQGVNYQWTLMVENREYILNILRPANFYGLAILDEVNKAQVSLEKALLFEDNQYSIKEYDEIWAKGVRPNRDSLEKYISLIADNNATVLFSKADNELINLKREFNQLKLVYERKDALVGFNTSSLLKSLQADIAPHVIDLEKNIQEINFLTQRIEQKYQDQFEQYQALKPWITLLEFIVAVMVAATIGSLLIISILKRIRFIRDNIRILSEGNLPKEIPQSGDELNTLIRALNELTTNLRVIKQFAIEVGEGKFDSEITIFNNEGELGVSLNEMKDRLSIVYQQERRRNWATEGLARFADILRRNNDNIDQLCIEVISTVVKYLEINQGGLFLLNTQQKPAFLELKAAYAFNKKKMLDRKILPGEGLLGQAFVEGGIVHIRKVPSDYTLITSGLGESPPASLLIVPLEYNNNVMGVLELTSFKDFESHQIEFLKNLAEIIASTIASVNTNDATRRLLMDSQQKTNAIKLQEEQLRQNAEELVATQEELEKNLNRAEREMNKLKSIIDHVAGAVLVYNDRGLIQFAGKYTEELFGYEWGGLIGISVNALFDIATTEESYHLLQSTKTSRQNKREILLEPAQQVLGLRKDGTTFSATLQVDSFEIGRERIFVATLQIL